MKNPQYFVVIKSHYTPIIQISSNNFEYCHQSLLNQITKNPYTSAQIIDTFINNPILVMREIL